MMLATVLLFFLIIMLSLNALFMVSIGAIGSILNIEALQMVSYWQSLALYIVFSFIILLFRK